MHDDHDAHRTCFGMTAPALGFLLWGLLAAAAEGQTLQEMIDAAGPGDTLRIESGDYLRAVTVDKAITLMPRSAGTVRLAGISGSAATVVGIAFDGALAGKATTLARCGSGITFSDCAFLGSTARGARLEAGAADVVFSGCSFTALVEGIGMEPGAVSLVLEDTEITDCIHAVKGPDAFPCAGGGEREPAARCESGCGSVVLDGVRIRGGGRQITINGDYTVTITESRLEQPTEWALAAGGVRLELSGTQCVSEGGTGTGLILHSVSGFVRNSTIAGWHTAVAVDDGGCPRYSDLVIGGARAAANDIGAEVLGLDVTQPEPVDADLNFWGTLACADVLAGIAGQTVARITDVTHTLEVDCPGTPAVPATWGRMKARYAPGDGGAP